MPEACFVCDAPLAPGGGRCDVCGFPTALTGSAVIALGRAGQDPASEGPVIPSPGPPSLASMPSDPAGSARQVERAATELVRSMEVLRALGGDLGDVTEDLRQAVIVDAEGQPTVALRSLGAARDLTVARSVERYAQRVQQLARLREALAEDGIEESDGAVSLAPTDAIRAGDGSDAAARLVAEDRRLAEIRRNWEELHARLAEADRLRTLSREIAEGFPRAESELDGIHAALETRPLSPRSLSELSGRVSELLRVYGDMIPPIVEEELDRHAARLGGHPAGARSGRKARELHAEAHRRLKRGELHESMRHLRELRTAVAALDREAQPEASGGPKPQDNPETQARLANLMVRIREIAGRVRHLPAGGQQVEEAALEIRHATDLIRSRDLDGADRILTRLMTSLAPGTASEPR